jgi:hypothetical protein
MRTTRDIIMFDHPFRLSAIDGTQPVGSYVVDVVEKPLEGSSFITYQNIKTIIYIPRLVREKMRVKAFSVDYREINTERCGSV